MQLDTDYEDEPILLYIFSLPLYCDTLYVFYSVGEYRTAVEREKGSAGSTHSNVYGVANVQDVNSTLALFVVWKKGASVTGWVGK